MTAYVWAISGYAESIKASAGQSSTADFHSSPSISFPVPVMRPEFQKETEFKGVLWMAKRNFPLSATCSSEFHDYISSASRGSCYDTNIGIAHQLGSVGMSKATQFISDLRDDGIKISIAGDLWMTMEWLFMEYAAMGLLATGR